MEDNGESTSQENYRPSPIAGASFSPELFVPEISPFRATSSTRQTQSTPILEEAAHSHTDDLSTELSSPDSGFKSGLSYQMYPSPYASPIDWGETTIGPETYESPHYFAPTCSLSSGQSGHRYLSPPALSTSSQNSRPRSYPDGLETFRTILPSSAIIDQTQEGERYCLESSPSCKSLSELKHVEGDWIMSRSQSLSPSQASPMPSSFSPNVGWHQSPLQSPPSMLDEITSNEPETDENPSDRPYAKLIWQAMMETPQKKMTLRQIYKWFEQNTTKPSDSGTNGWQNSIRHNLSMNQAFESERTDSAGPKHSSKKSSNVWVLTSKAIEHGVESTTRYRNKGNLKKSSRSRLPAPQRQKSGAKGGRAARRAAKQRQSEYDRSLPTQGGPSPRFHESAAIEAIFRPSYPVSTSPVTPILDGTMSCPVSADQIFSSDDMADQSLSHTGVQAEATAVPKTFFEHSEEQWQNDPWGAEWLSMEQIQQQSWDSLRHPTF